MDFIDTNPVHGIVETRSRLRVLWLTRVRGYRLYRLRKTPRRQIGYWCLCDTNYSLRPPSK